MSRKHLWFVGTTGQELKAELLVPSGIKQRISKPLKQLSYISSLIDRS